MQHSVRRTVAVLVVAIVLGFGAPIARDAFVSITDQRSHADAPSAGGPQATAARREETAPDTRSQDESRAAPSDTYRGRTEAWLGFAVYPALLNRSGSSAAIAYWAQKAIQSTPTDAARSMARSDEARRLQVDIAYQQYLGRHASAPDKEAWAELLTGGWSHDRLVGFLLSSSEQAAHTPTDAAWIDWTFTQALGRHADASAISYWEGRLDGGMNRNFAARTILASSESRGHAADLTYEQVRGTLPTSAERLVAKVVLDGTDGDIMRLRADVVGVVAPRGYRVAVVGDSVSFDLVFRARDQILPSVVIGGGQRPVGSGRLGCGVFSPRPGWLYPRDDELVTTPPSAPWGAPSDGKCPIEVPELEDTVLDTGPQVLVWPIGSWEWTRVKRPDGVILGARTSAMRSELVDYMVTRIDGWTARGVRKVLLPEWACPGYESAWIFRQPSYSRFVRSVLVEVVDRRPAVAAIAATPDAVCIDGDPTAPPTYAHRVARGDQFHWIAGPQGAAWGWRVWFAPAIADLRAVI